MRITPTEITKLKNNEIIVFGSNSKGDHAGGLAAYCKEKFKANTGTTRGITGQCYAIDTMSGLDVLKEQIQPFIETAKVLKDKTFFVTLIVCGIAGYKPEQIAPLFKDALEVDNIYLPKEFLNVIRPSVKGYKIFNPDFTCRGHKYKVGKEYEHKGSLVICQSGLHFCLKASHCFSYYSFDKMNIICEVEAIGDVVYHNEDSKAATNKLKIVRQLTWAEVLQVSNEGNDNTGHSNTGDRNTGDRNTGDRNTGDRNTGDSNTGDRNTGYRNTGNSNTGDSNTGGWNTGDSNTGDSNTGDRNTGDSNTGDSNTGGWNTGDRNTGYMNTGDRNTGIFCTGQKYMTLFDKPSKMTEEEFKNSKCYSLLCAVDTKMWVNDSLMTSEEKEANKGWKNSGGYYKDIPFKQAFKAQWDNWNETNRKAFTTLPNFNKYIFNKIVGIDIDKN